MQDRSATIGCQGPSALRRVGRVAAGECPGGRGTTVSIDRRRAEGGRVTAGRMRRDGRPNVGHAARNERAAHAVRVTRVSWVLGLQAQMEMTGHAPARGIYTTDDYAPALRANAHRIMPPDRAGAFLAKLLHDASAESTRRVGRSMTKAPTPTTATPPAPAPFRSPSPACRAGTRISAECASPARVAARARSRAASSRSSRCPGPS